MTLFDLLPWLVVATGLAWCLYWPFWLLRHIDPPGHKETA